MRENIYYLLDTWKEAHSYLKFNRHCSAYHDAVLRFLPLRIELAAMTQIILGRWLPKPMLHKHNEIQPQLHALEKLVPPETAQQFSAEFCENGHLVRKQARQAGSRGGGRGTNAKERQARSAPRFFSSQHTSSPIPLSPLTINKSSSTLT